MPQGTWVFDPDSGGTKVPESVKLRFGAQLQQVAAVEFAGRYTRLDILFRGIFCYIDAYTEPEAPGPNGPPDWSETIEQYIERLRTTPTHLCWLRYFGPSDRLSFGFYTYSNERYELSIFPSGDFFGTAEEALRVAAGTITQVDSSEAGSAACRTRTFQTSRSGLLDCTAVWYAGKSRLAGAHSHQVAGFADYRDYPGSYDHTCEPT